MNPRIDLHWLLLGAIFALYMDFVSLSRADLNAATQSPDDVPKVERTLTQVIQLPILPDSSSILAAKGMKITPRWQGNSAAPIVINDFNQVSEHPCSFGEGRRLKLRIAPNPKLYTVQLTSTAEFEQSDDSEWPQTVCLQIELESAHEVPIGVANLWRELCELHRQGQILQPSKPQTFFGTIAQATLTPEYAEEESRLPPVYYWTYPTQKSHVEVVVDSSITDQRLATGKTVQQSLIDLAEKQSGVLKVTRFQSVRSTSIAAVFDSNVKQPLPKIQLEFLARVWLEEEADPPQLRIASEIKLP